MSPHGTNSRCTNQGCRCEACCAAASDYSRRWRAGLVQRQPQKARHGSVGRYLAGCRCTRCGATDVVRLAHEAAQSRATTPAAVTAVHAAAPIDVLRYALLDALCARMRKVPRELLARVVDDAIATVERIRGAA